MPEVLTNQNDERDPRPIGRFLLGLESYDGKSDPFTYAKEFASHPGNFQKFKHNSAPINLTHETEIDGRKVDLQFAISKHAYIWKIIVAAEKFTTEHISTAYVPHGGEQYELHCSQPKSHAKYYEYNVQGRAIRQREFNSVDLLQKLQGLVEQIIDGPATAPDQ